MKDRKNFYEWGERAENRLCSVLPHYWVPPHLPSCRLGLPTAPPTQAALTKVGGGYGRLGLLDPGLLILCVSADLVQEKVVNEHLLPGGQWFFQGFKLGHQWLLSQPYVPSIGKAYLFKVCCQVCEHVHLILRETRMGVRICHHLVQRNESLV